MTGKYPLTPEIFENAALTSYGLYQERVERYSSSGKFLSDKDKYVRGLHRFGWTKKQLFTALKNSGYNFEKLRTYQRDVYALTIPVGDIQTGRNTSSNNYHLLGQTKLIYDNNVYQRVMNLFSNKIYLETIYRSIFHPIIHADWKKICSRRVFPVETLKFIAYHDFQISYDTVVNFAANEKTSRILNQVAKLSPTERVTFFTKKQYAIPTSDETYQSLCNLILSSGNLRG